jgi:hypothetical protein
MTARGKSPVARAIVPSAPTNAFMLSPLDAELTALIRRHGKEAVQQALSRLTKGKKGRPQDEDWPLLHAEMQRDAEDWIAGKEPHRIRSNYAIAKAFATHNRGQSQVATMRRVMGKLKEKRKWTGLVAAYGITSGSHVPHGTHIKIIKQLCNNFEKEDPSWAQHLSFSMREIELFRGRVGEPDQNLSISQIERENRSSALLHIRLPSHPAD